MTFGAAINAVLEEGDRDDLRHLVRKLLEERTTTITFQTNFVDLISPALAKVNGAITIFREALEFYADPHGRVDDLGADIAVPAFYDTLDYGRWARDALDEASDMIAGLDEKLATLHPGEG